MTVNIVIMNMMKLHRLIDSRQSMMMDYDDLSHFILSRNYSRKFPTKQRVELRKKLVIWTHFFGLFSPLLPHRSKPSCAQRGTLL